MVYRFVICRADALLLLTEKTVAMIIGRVRQWRDAHRRKKKETENNIIEGK